MAEDKKEMMTITEIGRLTGIPMGALMSLVVFHSDRIPCKGEGRDRRYPPEAVEIFQELNAKFPKSQKQEGAASRNFYTVPTEEEKARSRTIPKSEVDLPDDDAPIDGDRSGARHAFKMRRVPLPAWAREAKFELSGVNDELLGQILGRRKDILAMVHKEVEDYLNDDEMVYNDPDDPDVGFPNLAVMTGEYYISDEDYSNEENDSHYLLSVMVHCTEKQWVETQVDFDYLGLDICITCDKKTWKLSLGGTNQSVI